MTKHHTFRLPSCTRLIGIDQGGRRWEGKKGGGGGGLEETVIMIFIAAH